MLVALTIAGSDSVGGAGVEADIKALASQGVHAAVAVTAVTAQNTRRVADIFPLAPEAVVAQLDAVLEDVHVSAAKTGMLYSAAIATAVADRIGHERFPRVIDPVLVAGVGDPLNREDLIDALNERVVPIATILTPNVPEAEALTGITITEDRDVRKACRKLADRGAEAVLLKGGHLEGRTCVDTFFYNDKFLQLESPRVECRGHGGGCVLSAYLTANLAKGMGLWEGALAAKGSIGEAVRYHYAIGKGVPVVDPLGKELRDAQRYQVYTRLRKASLALLEVLPTEWMPDDGTEVVFALPGASDPEEVCALDARADGRVGTAVPDGPVGFGTSRHLASTVLIVMRYDGGMRSAMDLRFSEDRVHAFQKAGMSIGSLDQAAGPGRSRRTIEKGTEDAINTLGFVPDVIYDRGSRDQEPMVRLLASSPEELLGKLKMVLD